MRRSSLLLLLVVACGSRTALNGGGATGGSGGASDAATPVGDAASGGSAGGHDASSEGDAPVQDLWLEQLAGYWMQPQIGDCINAEEWFTLAPPSGFTHTWVDRDFCGPHSVHAETGKLTTEGHTLEVTWPSGSGFETRRRTVAVLGVHPAPGISLDPSYVPGDRGLDLMGYWLAPGEAQYLRHDLYETNDGLGSFYRVGLEASLGFGAPLEAPTSPTPCTMHIVLGVSIESSQATAQKASETFDLPCHVEPSGMFAWSRVVADGFGTESWAVSEAWQKYLEDHGIYTKYPGALGDAIHSGFLPLLFFAPSDPNTLFHDRSDAWMIELKNPPPSSVP